MEKIQTYMNGNPLTLLGKIPEVGASAPDFLALDSELLPRGLSDFHGKKKLFNVVPSLDTNICDQQSRNFNKEAHRFGEDVMIITVSMDLPFAQLRWMREAEIDQLVTLSDHREASFGYAYGVLIAELRLLNRSIFVVDAEDTIKYSEIVEENNTHPNYDRALQALSGLTD